MFYTFTQIRNKSKLKNIIGAKAKSLITMREWDIPVPDGGCITTEAYDAFVSLNNFNGLINGVINCQDKNIRTKNVKSLQAAIMKGELPEELTAAMERFLAENEGKRFAVRSSGTKEDLQGNSFAGQYSTILNVTSKDNLIHAIKECWASLYNERLLSYCLDHGIHMKDLRLAVIIQEMVPSEKSGVVFTVNPLKGFDKEMVIEACFGLGEALVGGEVTPDRYFYDWYQRTENERIICDKSISIIAADHPPYTKKVENPEDIRKKAVLTKGEVEELAAIALKIQVNYGYPVDIEWAKANGRFYILQGRPVTRISFSGIEGEWSTANLKDGGVASAVCTPYMWALYHYIIEMIAPVYFKKLKLLDMDRERSFGSMHFGRGYWAAHIAKDCYKRLPGFIERHYDEDIGIEITYEGSGYTSKTNLETIWNALKVGLSVKKCSKEQIKSAAGFRKRQSAKLKELDNFDPDSLSPKEFYQFFEKFMKEEFTVSEGSYFMLVFLNSVLQPLFKKSAEKIAKGFDILPLMSGLDDVSHMLPIYQLWDISRLIRKDAQSYRFWKNTPVEALQALWRENDTKHYMDRVAQYIKEYKFHSTRELDLMVPRYGEDPSFVMSHIKNYIELDETQDPRTRGQKQNEAYIRERERFLKLCPAYKRRSMAKKIDEMRTFLWWREEYRDLSTRYYYHIRKFTLVLARHFVEAGRIDEIDDIFFLSLLDLFDILHGKMNAKEIKDLVYRNKLYYQSFRNFQNPNEIGNRYHSDKSSMAGRSAMLKGTPSSSGEVTGTARVIKDIFDSHRIEKGDILITKFTDPGWAPVFGLIKGVATEAGGLLSHAAVISREYGIPSVLAVKDITEMIKDGQKITLNGTKGEIIIHDTGL